MDTSVDLNLLIENEWRPAATGQTLDVDNPSTGEVIGRAAMGDRSDAIVTLEADSRAFSAWYKTTGDGRSRLLKKLAKSFMTKANTCEKSWTIL